MQSSRLALLLLICTCMAMAQLDTNSVTVTASRTLSSTPDQVVFSITIAGPLTSTLDDAVAQLQVVGVTAASLYGVTTANVIPLSDGSGTSSGGIAVMPVGLNSLYWTFHLTVPFAKLKDTMTALVNLQTALPQKTPPWTLSYLISGTQTSAQAQPACPISDLLAEARSKAQAMTDAAAMTLGPVLAISGATPSNSNCFMTLKFVLSR